MTSILIIDDEAGIRRLLGLMLGQAGYAVAEADTGPAGVAAVRARRPDLVLCDVALPGFDGISVLRQLKDESPATPVVMITGESSTELAIRAMALGAADYLVKPLDLDRTRRVVRDILESVRSPGPEPAAGGGRTGGPELIGKSDAMYEVCKLIGRVAGQSSTVLILGESGTGKELVARAIHAHGPRRTGPFVPINCAAIPEALLESELFGHEKGAFTGADRQRPGKFEQADGGTIFLDEIGDTSPALQAKLLRVLQDQEFYRLGGVEPVRTAARIVAATNRDLRPGAGDGSFRGDLFYRLSGVVIRLPPLRDRRADIPLLADYFLRQSPAVGGGPARAIAPAAMDLLTAHEWPGNVRELANVVRQAALLAPGPTILPEQLAGLVPAPAAPPRDPAPTLFDPVAIRRHVAGCVAANDQGILEPLLTAFEREVLRAAFDECGGNVSHAARHLGIHRITLKAKLDAGAAVGT